MIIVCTVLIQGALVSSDHRGSFDVKLLTVNTGIFQAIGVISFGKLAQHRHVQSVFQLT